MDKAKLYTRIDPLFERVHGILFNIKAWATVTPPTCFHKLECSFGGLTQQEENALGDLVVGYVEGFDSWIGGGVESGILEGLTDAQAHVLLGVLQAFVEGFGGSWEYGNVYSVDSEGVRDG